ncbi:MAG: 23S rRNA (pseudouridine(1915)-N(3))-methyltransferase RlmH [Anaerosomatales bacterium]|nr:23S rRNA (pseudouridine(1915)-N(3))-methyltransferase RlmH [Anaerosomatales bacterium]MDT8434723.1 23S rRNA (pseudouridine(1915)-N(3))-methyltransferase RlmH [Anaerosomatales bacterium]
MRVTLVAVGRLKEAYWRDGAAEYLKRLRPYATVEVIEVPDRDVTRDEARALSEEAADVLRALPDGAHVVALEISGRALSSEGFADDLADHMVGGRSHVAFVLGGAAGLAPGVLARADSRLSLGPMTLPHQLARVVLLEQIYRAFRIVRGEPYHR